MKYLVKIARRFGISLVLAFIVMLVVCADLWAKSQSDAQEVEATATVLDETNVTNTHSLTSSVGGPPVGGVVVDTGQVLTASSAITLDIDAPWFTFSPYIKSWGHWVRISNYDTVTHTALLAVHPVSESNQPGLDHLEVHISPIGTCEYSADHSEALCTFDIAPNWYWDIYMAYDLNTIADPPHWEIVQCINSGPRKCETTNVYFPLDYFAVIYLPVIRR